MIWAAISYTGRVDPVHVQADLTAQRYIDTILQPHLLPVMDVQRQIFQQDIARPQMAHVTTNFLATKNVQVLPWPSRSPDFNAIEHIWDELDRRLRQQQRPPQTLQELAVCLQDEWRRIPQQLSSVSSDP